MHNQKSYPQDFQVQRITIVQNYFLALLYRSLHSNFCYNQVEFQYYPLEYPL
ncbi:hypothetical protein Lhac_1078 [Legionella hackeliae]|nr:hypothetical protein Lhac_1078 [Legionella hackeliae]